MFKYVGANGNSPNLKIFHHFYNVEIFYKLNPLCHVKLLFFSLC